MCSFFYRPRKIIRISLAILCGILTGVIITILWLMRPYTSSEDYSGDCNTDCLVAHAGGKTLGGETYTNSREALINSIKKGYKYIELDLYFTKDSQLVCLHKLDDFMKMTGRSIDELDSKTFCNVKFYNKYSPMRLSEAVEIWNQSSFVFVTD